jgi:hypothetical protein
MALVNRLCLLEYDVGGAQVLHERLVLLHAYDDHYASVTPDGDVYVEEMSAQNAELRSFRIRPAPGVDPPGVIAATVYRLPAFTAVEIGRFMGEARVEVNAARAAQGIVAAAVAAPAAVVAVAAPAGAAVVVAVPPQNGLAADETPGLLQWLASEAMDNVGYGRRVVNVGAAMVSGARAVHVLPSGKQMFVACVAGEDVQEFQARPGGWDARMLPLVLSPMGTPERSLASVAQTCQEEVVKWELPGPRSAKWCINYLVVEGLGLEGHHERVRQVCKLDAGAWGIQEHFQTSMQVRQALQVDQVDGYNCLFLEVMFRRLQTVEFAYAEKALEAESRSVGGRMNLEEQGAFSGITRQAATLMVCPALRDHVRTEVEKEVLLQKNLRKAREEREASRNTETKKNGKKGKKGKDEEEHP